MARTKQTSRKTNPKTENPFGVKKEVVEKEVIGIGQLFEEYTKIKVKDLDGKIKINVERNLNLDLDNIEMEEVEENEESDDIKPVKFEHSGFIEHFLAAYLERPELLPDYKKWENYCTECGQPMGECNPRQLCCKTHCENSEFTMLFRTIMDEKNIVEKYKCPVEMVKVLEKSWKLRFDD